MKNLAKMTVPALALLAVLGACGGKGATAPAATGTPAPPAAIDVGGTNIERAKILPLSAVISAAERDVDAGSSLTQLLGAVDAVEDGVITKVSVDTSVTPPVLTAQVEATVLGAPATSKKVMSIAWEVFLADDGRPVNANGGQLPARGDHVLLLVTATDAGTYVPFNSASQITVAGQRLVSSSPASTVAKIVNDVTYSDLVKASSGPEVGRSRQDRVAEADTENRGRTRVSPDIVVFAGEAADNFRLIAYRSQGGLCYTYRGQKDTDYQCFTSLDPHDLLSFTFGRFVGGIVGSDVTDVQLDSQDPDSKAMTVAVSEMRVGDRTLRYFVVPLDSSDRALHTVATVVSHYASTIVETVQVAASSYDFVYTEKDAPSVECYGFWPAGNPGSALCVSAAELSTNMNNNGGIAWLEPVADVQVGICNCSVVALSSGSSTTDVPTKPFPQGSRAEQRGLHYFVHVGPADTVKVAS